MTCLRDKIWLITKDVPVINLNIKTVYNDVQKSCVFTFNQRCHSRSQARKLVIARPSGMNEGGEEVKLVNLGLPDQLVYNSMEGVGWSEEQVLLTIARLPNEKYPYRK